jgi:hypothetical protein
MADSARENLTECLAEITTAKSKIESGVGVLLQSTAAPALGPRETVSLCLHALSGYSVRRPFGEVGGYRGK